jgi:hypothetical protein
VEGVGTSLIAAASPRHSAVDRLFKGFSYQFNPKGDNRLALLILILLMPHVFAPVPRRHWGICCGLSVGFRVGLAHLQFFGV